MENDSSNGKQEAEQFWHNPLWWLISKALTTLGLASPIAGVIVFISHMSDLKFELAAWYVWFLCGTIIFVVPLTLLNYYSTKYLSSYNAIISATDSLSGQYAFAYLRKMSWSFIVTVSVGIGYWALTEDYSALLSIVAYLFITVGYYSVITIRTKSHLFGTNSVEAEELLSFLYARRDEDGPRPRRMHVPQGATSRMPVGVPDGKVASNPMFSVSSERGAIK